MAIKYWNYSTCNIDSRADIGDECVIHSHVSIHRHVKIGKKCQIEAYAFIPDGVEIGDNVFIGPHVSFTNDPILESRESWKPTPTIVKNGAKIGANCTIRAGVTIGENSLIGQHSNVLKDVPANQVWVGNPARFLRNK